MDTLPRSPSDITSPASDRNLTYSNRKPSKMESFDTEDHKRNLQELNNRLVSYVEKVRKLQTAVDVMDSLPVQTETSEEKLKTVKSQYVAEIDGWRVKYEEAQSLVAQLQIELANIKKENQQLNLKVEDKQGALRDRDNTIAALEAEIAEVISKLNLLQKEKGRLIQNETVYKSDIADLKKELEASKKALDRERVRASELEAKLGSLDQEMNFQLQLKTTELEKEKKKNKIDLTAIDNQIKTEYEMRLKAELAKLRAMYEEGTEKAKQEFMHLHSNKVTELQTQLSVERSENSSAKGELQGYVERMEQYKRAISRLEGEKLDLQANLEQQGQSFRAQMSSKDGEIKLLQKEMKEDRKRLEKLLEHQQQLEMEIKIYRNILEDEENRISRVSAKFSKNISRGRRGVGGDSDSSDGGAPNVGAGAIYRNDDTTDGYRGPGGSSEAGRRNVNSSSYSYSTSANNRHNRLART